MNDRLRAGITPKGSPTTIEEVRALVAELDAHAQRERSQLKTTERREPGRVIGMEACFAGSTSDRSRRDFVQGNHPLFINGLANEQTDLRGGAGLGQ